jgi:TetR/AcrR family transcriptional regulator, regulator of cefoperazone and chloramphenicol sensitivity
VTSPLWALAAPTEPRSRRGVVTRQRILLAAADLFAERGIDAVHPQEILEAAGQRNASAIQYHFGSREGLIVAVLQPRPDVRNPIDEERARMLDELLAGGAPLTLAGAVATWALPAALALATRPGRSFMRVAAQVIRTLPFEHRVTPAMPSDRRARAVIARVLPPLPSNVAAERIAVAGTLMIELLANRAREIEDGVTLNLRKDEFEAELVAMLTGLLGAPPGGTRVEPPGS